MRAPRRSLILRAGCMRMSRCEGGQNDLGPEQAPQLGLIRTQELLAATRGYGVRLYFTRAKDFGYSKTPEETEHVWGDQVLEDMVRVIRGFRPNMVINGWGGVHGGHGHHQAAGLLTPKAVQLAADSSYKLKGPRSDEQDLAPWGDHRPVILLDVNRNLRPQSAEPIRANQGSPPAPGKETTPTEANSDGYILPLDEISPLYGKSWREIGLDAFANHRTQGITGFLNSPFLRRPITLKREDGCDFDASSLNEPLGPLDEDFEVGNKGVDPLMRVVDASLIAARDAALRLDYKASADSLIAAGKKLDQIPVPSLSSQLPAPMPPLAESVRRKRDKINAALTMVTGLRLNAVADRSEIVPGESFTVRVDPRHRDGVAADFRKPTLTLPPDWAITNEETEANGAVRFTISVPSNISQFALGWPSRPLRNSISGATAYLDALLPEPPPLIAAAEDAVLNGYAFTATSAVTSIHATSPRADRVSPRLVPAYSLAVEPRQMIDVLAGAPKPFDVLLRVHSYATQAGEVSVSLVLPRGWNVGAPVPLKFSGIGDEYARFKVMPPPRLQPGNYKIAAQVFEKGERASSVKPAKFSLSLEPLPTMPTLLWAEPSQCLVHAFAINVPQNLHVGYITAESEPVPDALRMLGVQVDLLDAQALAFRDLSKFNAIVVGVRAYELRPDLPGANQRLLDYASNGGTLVVQYQRDFAWDRSSFAPYPALISPPVPPAKEGSTSTSLPRPLPRITDENSPVKLLKPGDPLLNRPNKI